MRSLVCHVQYGPKRPGVIECNRFCSLSAHLPCVPLIVSNDLPLRAGVPLTARLVALYSRGLQMLVDRLLHVVCAD